MTGQVKMPIWHVLQLLQIFILKDCCMDAYIITGQFNTTNTMTGHVTTPVTNIFPTNANLRFSNMINRRTRAQAKLHYTVIQSGHRSSSAYLGKGLFEEAQTLAMYFIGSSYCKEMQTCLQSNGLFETFPTKSCYCDALCNILDDCCVNYNSVENFPYTKQQFECTVLDGLGNVHGYGIYIITSCSDNWKNDDIRSLCENLGHDIFLITPVTDKSKNEVTYRNMYCAQCNFVYDFEYWKTNIGCSNNKTDISNCTIKHEIPKNISIRFCETNIKANCSAERNHWLSNNCTNGPFSLVYARGKAYRNIYCAYCDGYNNDELFCTEIKSGIPTAQTKYYSFRLLVDLNTGIGLRLCTDNEIYDPFSNVCRQIYCALPSIPRKGTCVTNSGYDTTLVYYNSSATNNCTLVKVNSEEYKILNASIVLLLYNQVVLNGDNFRIIGTDMYVCRNMIASCNSDCRDANWFFDSTLGSYITLVGLTISIIFLAITFFVYICTPKLLNIHGKNLVCLIVVLSIAHVTYLVSPQAEGIPPLCKCIAVLLHFLYLSSFTWMNVIAFDFYTTFSRRFNLVERNRNHKRFMLYSIYAWCTPLVMIVISVSFDFVEVSTKVSSYKPGYGKGLCWIASSNALFVFVAIPLSVFKLFDFVAFTMTMVYISRGRRQGAKVTKKTDACTCIINLKLSIIMGVTWVLAFVANISKSISVWYLFIAFNSLQGMFIAVCFICSKTVLNKIKAKFNRASASYTNSAT